jgi:dipeptidyl aminopeptidase/acylaminoacyl peptidase
MNSRTIRNCFITTILVIIAIVAVAQETKVLTPEMVESLKVVNEVAISPDGKLVAYTLIVPRCLKEPSGGSYVELYVMPFDGGEARPFVTGQQRVGSITFCPFGMAVTFLADRGDKTQIYALPIAGGEARQITHSPTGIRDYRWSPDATKIAYLTRDDFCDEEKKNRKAGRDMELIEQNFRYSRLHIFDMKTGKSHPLTPAEYEVYDFNWSPDGTKLVITASDIPTTDASYMLKHLYLVDVEDGSRELLCETEGKLATPVWSPDGSKIAWNGGVDMSDASLSSVFVCDLAERQAVNLTGEDIYTAMSVTWLDDNTLAVPAFKYQDTILFTMAPDGSSKQEILGPGPIFRSPSFSKDGTKFAVSASTPQHPNELWCGSMDGKLTKMTDSNPWLKDIKLGRQEVVEWTAQDGLKIQGVLIYPVDYKEGERYPLVVNPHGGPEGVDLNGWITRYSKWGQMLAGEGYFAFMPNYRASIGRGVAYAKADHNDLGGKETQDVIDGIDHLIDKGLADGSRVGSGGGSYGGYFSALAATKHSKRYAAAVVFAGITNWYSFQGTTDISIENSHTHWNIRDWHLHPEILWQASPVAYIAQAQTPTLIAHGERDLRVPLGQGQELYRNLVFKGTPVEMVVYPRAGHGLRENQHRLDYARRALDWFNKWLKTPVEQEELD